MRLRYVRSCALSALFAFLPPVAAGAQESPTEREPARDVLKKMAALEQSLDVPGFAARVHAPNPDRDQVVARVKELMDNHRRRRRTERDAGSHRR